MRVPVQDLLYSSRETACDACGLWSQDMNLRYGSGHGQEVDPRFELCSS